MICPSCHGNKIIESTYTVGEEGMEIEVDAEYKCDVCEGDGLIDLELVSDVTFANNGEVDYVLSANYKGQPANDYLLIYLSEQDELYYPLLKKYKP